MKKGFYTEEKRYTIYALICRADGPWVYVGKTKSPRISAVYSQHRCSEVGATQGYCDQPDDMPELYVLEVLHITGAQAYRYVLAYLRYFLENGYCAMNHSGTEDQALALHPETQEIYETISQEPLDNLLAYTYVDIPADANLHPEPEPLVLPKAVREKTEQMNVRMSQKDKQRFEAFCRARGVNQRQGFALLLEKPGEEGVLGEMKTRLCKLQAENQKLRNQLDIQTGKAAEPVEEKARDYLQFLLPGLKRYLDSLFASAHPVKPLPKTNYRKFQRTNPFADAYGYPEQEGFYKVTPEAVVWGISDKRPCFVMCLGENGERYKLRTYPRERYAGYSFRSPLPVEPGTKWLIGVRKAKDGAMEIAAAFPLPDVTESGSQEETAVQQKLSLDSLIRSAKEGK